jgi:parallel beta-helix repeat protein
VIGSSAFVFKIQPVKADGTGTIYINTDGSMSPPTALISTVDNITYTFTGNIFNESIVIQRDNIVLDGVCYTLQGNGSGIGLDLSGITNVTTQNIQITDFDEGVQLNSASSNVISGNNITGNKYEGMLLTSSNLNIISGNNVTGTLSGNGIELESCSNNMISFNNVAGNYGRGILLSSSDNNTFYANDVALNLLFCIELFDYSDYNVISGNNIANNSPYGIKLDYYSDNNTISENNMVTNADGMGIQVSSGNIIYHNNFVNSSRYINANQVQSDGLSSNAWDNGYPSGGNYWSDYNGSDDNKDGIGDIPYIIDANNADRYPLMASYLIPEFSSIIILPLLFIMTWLAILVCRKRVKRKPNELGAT